MIQIDVQQNTVEWLALRLGIPTSSNFDRILTPKTMKPSSSAEGLLHEKLAEWMLGEPLDQGASPWMDRGSTMELEAVTSYEFERDVDTQPGGFVLRDDRMVGCSPDRLVGADGGLEIKCPSAKVHVAYLLGNVAEEHRCQVQGHLWLCEREWWDVMSYNPVMPTVVVRVTRDESFIKALSGAVDGFLERLSRAREEMLRRGFSPREKAKAPADAVSSGDFGGVRGLFNG